MCTSVSDHITGLKDVLLPMHKKSWSIVREVLFLQQISGVIRNVLLANVSNEINELWGGCVYVSNPLLYKKM